jgi:polyhydroxybutyrate depolymerase
MHFHGTADHVVPFDGLPQEAAESFRFLSVPETIAFWIKVNQCLSDPHTTACADAADDGITVERTHYCTASGETRVVLFKIIGGGHTWPGREPPPAILGRSTKDISANDLMWEFFQQHRLP